MLGAAPRTRLCGVVIVLIAAAAAVVQPANIFGRTLPMEQTGSRRSEAVGDRTRREERSAAAAGTVPRLRTRWHQRDRDGPHRLDTGATPSARPVDQSVQTAAYRTTERSDFAVTRGRPPVHHRHARPDREAHCREQQRRLQRTGGRCRLMRCFRLQGGFGACVGPQRERALRRAPCRLCPGVHADSRRRHHEDARDRGREALGVRPTRAGLAERDNHCSSGGSRPRGGITRWHRLVPR